MATTWFSKAVDDGIEADDPSPRIQAAFLPFFAAAGWPADMAVFSRYDLTTNVVTVYFTPAAASLALSHGATPCEKPSSEDIGLLVGDQHAWQLFFPERLSGGNA